MAGQFDSARNAWLLDELAKSPESVAAACRIGSILELTDDNTFLDSYLIRLLRLKRALAALLDIWEKVDHYAILGISPTASDKELKVAYRKACLVLHPDKGGDKVRFQQLQDSYARILEERARKKDSMAPVDPNATTNAQSSACRGNG